MASEGSGIQSAKVIVAALATVLWVGTSLAVAGVVETAAGVTAVTVGVPFLALLFAYHVFFHESQRERAQVVAALLAVTGMIGLVAIFVQQSTVSFVANVMALLGMFALVALFWR